MRALAVTVSNRASAGVYEDRREARIRAEVAALLPGLQDFVAAERGLPFRADVEVEVLDDDAFLDALYDVPEDAPEDREDRDAEPTLKTLGLLEEDAANGLLRGLQDTRVPMLIALFGYWAAGFGVALLLGFGARWGGVGIWTGLAVGLAVVSALLGWRWSARERLGLLPAA